MKPVLFDFNGTLYNDTRFHIAAWKRFLETHLKRPFTEEEVLVACIGPANEEILHRMIDPQLTDAQIEELGEEKETYYRAACRSKEEYLQLIKGAPEMLDTLTRRGVPFALATGSGIGNINFYLNDLGLKRWFNMDRITYDDGIIPNKPDAAFYTDAARRIGYTPKDCVVVEDSATGILAARNAGAGMIISLTGTMTEAQKANCGDIAAWISDFTDIEKVFEKLGVL